jgi:hypothetical protein
MRAKEFIVENITPNQLNILKQLMHKHGLDYGIYDKWYAIAGWGDIIDLLQSYGGVPEFEDFYDDFNKLTTPTVDRWTGGNQDDDQVYNLYTDLVNNGFFN